MRLVETAVSEFSRRYASEPETVSRAPGRLELIGNHTDYNGGYILAAAVDLYTVIAARGNGTSTVRLHAMELDQSAEFDLSGFERGPVPHWADYSKAVILELQRVHAPVEGFDAVIHSNIPIGMGLGSSAALELSFAFVLKGLFGHTIEGMDLAQLCLRAENDFCGAAVGILDQFCGVFGEEQHLLFLDCLTLEHRAIHLKDSGCALVVADSAVEHSIVEGKYADRRNECFRAVELLEKELNREIKLLREVGLEEFYSVAEKIPETERKRARHIIEENQRVLAGAQAARAGDLGALGKLIFSSHQSSSTLFENSCYELDKLVEIASRHPAILGAKLSGGGFGGCTANLVRKDGLEAFIAFLEREYQGATGLKTRIIPCSIGRGAGFENI